MKSLFFTTLFLLIFQSSGYLSAKSTDVVILTDQSSVRERLSFNNDWFFLKNDQIAQPDLNDVNWKHLNLPHDWAIEGPFVQEYPGNTGKRPYWGIGWYRKSFSLSKKDRNSQFYLDMDGAMSHSTVWLNGKLLGGWPYGYTSFRLDLTSQLNFGKKNELIVRLENPDESSRWYPGGGIYRNVWLVKTSKVHIGHWGTYVTTPIVEKQSATVHVNIQMENQSGSNAKVLAKTQVYELSKDGRKRNQPIAVSNSQLIEMNGVNDSAHFEIVVTNPKIWDVRTPNLYVAVTSLEQSGKIVDRYETIFGIRTIKFDPDKGFFLNGEHLKINGVCNHHDLGALGTAVNTRALERQIELLKEMGCNAIRTSHNPPAPELLELCDKMGMLIMDEAFDCWAGGKTKNDYHLDYALWHEKDLRAMVRRDRNHPCVILWSIGNEVQEQGKPNGPEVAAGLSEIIRSEDPTRPTSVGCNNSNAGFNGFQKGVDVFGYNYKPGLYEKFHTTNPEIPLIGSETSSCISTRGEYFFPVDPAKSGGKANFQMSSYDLYAPGWGSSPDFEFVGQDKNPHVAGEFVWTGFDYLGEPTPYNKDVTNLLNFSNPEDKAKMEKELKELGKIAVPSRSSYFGIMDLCGFKKDRFYSYQSKWRPDFPMAHLFPHWNWSDRIGQITPVHLYTSGDEAELFLNGVSQGRKKKEPFQYRLQWDSVCYQPGELKVIAYKNGEKWAENVVKTTGQAFKIQLSPDRNELMADGSDLSYVTISITDKEGLTVPNAKNRLTFELTGPGEIVAVDNGDPTCHESFQSKERNAFNGLCLVIIRTKAGQSGNIVLKAQSAGLKDAVIQMIAK
ncbi:MAG TPA: beta-galactosidase GalB [Bacteroidales bacterium]|nr:beta-galactosidase GalB [Bacteroidales bacterium]